MNIAAVIEALSNPGPLARPMPMWFWNGRLDRDILTEQLDDMADKGIGAFFIHPMPQEFRPKDFGAGMETEYLGDEYLNAVRHVVESAAVRRMKVWLYDEGGWPSGSNLGRVAKARPDLRGKVARYNEEGQVEILERGYAVDLLNPDTARTFIEQVHERYASAVGNHFGSTIVGFFTDEPRYGGRVGGAEIPWTDKLPEIFREKKGYDLKLGLPILFGLKVSQSIPQNKRAQVTCDFFHVVTQIWRDSYFRVLQSWCHDHDLLLVGHLNNEDTLHGHVTNGGDFFKAMECMDWPGIDVITRQIFPGSPSNDFPKYASSAAHLRGKERVLSESFAVYGWDLTYAQMKWATDYQFVRGVNAIAPMAFYGDARGPRKIGTMSDQFRVNSLWEHYSDYADYVGRLGTLLSLGKPVVEVGVYYPIKSMWVGEDEQRIERECARLGRSLLERQIDFDYLDDDAICRGAIDKSGALYVGDCRYTTILFSAVSIVPIETFRQLKAFAEAGGAVAFLNGEPHLTCRAATQTELSEILGAMATFTVAQGGDADVVLGTLPRTAKLGMVNPAIRVSRRTTGDTEIFFLTNESPTSEHALRIRLPIKGIVYLFDPETGTLTRAQSGDGTVRHTLPPSGSVAMLASDDEIAASEQTPRRKPERTLTVGGPWSLTVVEEWKYRDGEVVVRETVEEPMGGELIEALKVWGTTVEDESADETEPAAGSSVRIDELADWSTVFSPTFCGTVDCMVALEVGGSVTRAVLDLGTVGVVAEVVVNDESVGRRTWAPYEFDISDAVTPGLNTIHVTVTSTLHHLMASDEVVADLKERGWFNTYAQQVAKFGGDPAPAGLIGPVKLHLW